MTAATQAEFARQLGVNRSHVTRLKHAGRLVLTADGLVEVEASHARIIDTADPNRDDVVTRHARARGAIVSDLPLAEKEEIDINGNKFQEHRSLKEKYLALDAKASYESRIGELIPRAEVESALDDVVEFARSSLENLPHRVAGLLVGRDYDAILATLRQEVVGLMGDMHKDAQRQFTQLTAAEDNGRA